MFAEMPCNEVFISLMRAQDLLDELQFVSRQVAFFVFSDSGGAEVAIVPSLIVPSGVLLQIHIVIYSLG